MVVSTCMQSSIKKERKGRAAQRSKLGVLYLEHGKISVVNSCPLLYSRLSLLFGDIVLLAFCPPVNVERETRYLGKLFNQLERTFLMKSPLP